MDDIPTALAIWIAVIIFPALFIGIAGWTYAVVRMLAGHSPLAARPLDHMQWGLPEFAFALGMYICCLSVVGPSLGAFPTPEKELEQTSVAPPDTTAAEPKSPSPQDRDSDESIMVSESPASPETDLSDGENLDIADGSPALTPDVIQARTMADLISRTVPVLLLLIWLVGTAPQVVQRFGLLPTLQDIQIGVVAACMILPPVLLGHVVLVQLLAPYQHEVLDSLREGLSPTLLGLIALNTVVVASFQEEIVCRLFLQGGLQRFLDFQKSGDIDPAASGTSGGESARRYPMAWFPLLATSLFFGLIHFNQGPAPISLFFLSLGIGYVMRQTGRLWPCIIIHMCLNGLTIATVLFEYYSA